jgi:hypothetical protein
LREGDGLKVDGGKVEREDGASQKACAKKRPGGTLHGAQ